MLLTSFRRFCAYSYGEMVHAHLGELSLGVLALLYHMYEMNHAAVQPLRWMAKQSADMFSHPLNPAAYTQPGRTAAAALNVFDRITKRYGKPVFGITETQVEGATIPVEEEIIWESTWCKLKHFRKSETAMRSAGLSVAQPSLLIVAPMSGHYATLLRGTVEAMLPDHDVVITDWSDARQVPIIEGRFDLHDYIDTLIAIFREAMPRAHVMAVCQPGPATLAATALMAEANDQEVPSSLIIMGSPIDPRRSPTVPNQLAESQPIKWFRDKCVSTVPWPNPGMFREVYPGFMQLTSFISMNHDKHMDAYWDYFGQLVAGDGDSVAKHKAFYDEYLAVMDLTAEYYIQTVDEIFQRHLLPKGEFMHRGQLVRPELITGTALMTVEGENDDISGIGQTQAAHDLCSGIPDSMQIDYVQKDVGHYGVFNGSRFRNEIRPKITEFILAHDDMSSAVNVVPFTPSKGAAN